MYEKVFAYLDAHAEDYAAQLCRWVEVPSVKGEATPDAPFGNCLLYTSPSPRD